MALSSDGWLRRDDTTRADESGAQPRCEEECGTMAHAPDHTGMEKPLGRSARPVAGWISYRSLEIMKRQGAVSKTGIREKGESLGFPKPGAACWTQGIRD